jgi:hypothetical protein
LIAEKRSTASAMPMIAFTDPTVSATRAEKISQNIALASAHQAPTNESRPDRLPRTPDRRVLC